MNAATARRGEGQARTRPLRLLTFSTLYPNPAQPNHGVFVENRLRHLVSSGEAESTVLAPVPWFPGRGPGAVPAEEHRHGLAVHHPRFLAIPKLGLATNPYALWRAARTAFRRLRAEGLAFDLIDGHYLYPDGVAAVWLAEEAGLPVVLTARGSDTSQLPHYRIPGSLIRQAIDRADALIAVSAALGEGLHIILPWDHIYIYDMRVQEHDEAYEVIASEGLQVSVRCSFRWHLNKSTLPKLHKEIASIQDSPKVQQQLAAAGADIRRMSVTEFGAFQASELEKWGKVVRQAGIKAQ